MQNAKCKTQNAKWKAAEQSRFLLSVLSFCILPFAFCTLHSLSLAAEPPPACHALLIGGLPGPAVYSRRYSDWLKRFHAYLTTTAKVPAANIVVLSGDAGLKDAIVSGQATAKAIREALTDMAKKLKPGDQFILLLVGHGAVAETIPSILLPGPDLNAQELADALSPIAARNQVVLNFTASAGDALRFLARKERANVAATSPTEVTEPVFAEFFLRGLESARADGEGTPNAGTLDKTITLLEATNWATYQAALWIARQKSTEAGWRIDGKESIEIFRKLYVGADGEPATRKLSPDSNADLPDAPVPLRPEGGQIDGHWRGRRILAEHAVLEDCGEEKGVCPLRDDGYKPLDGLKEGEPGWLARRVVLGRPALLP